MALDRISLQDFRNHAATTLDRTAQFNLLVGANGAGKTNVLEALSLLAPGRGLRRARLPEMARKGGSGGFAIGAEAARRSRAGAAGHLDRACAPHPPQGADQRGRGERAGAVRMVIGALADACDGRPVHR